MAAPRQTIARDDRQHSRLTRAGLLLSSGAKATDAGHAYRPRYELQESATFSLTRVPMAACWQAGA